MGTPIKYITEYLDPCTAQELLDNVQRICTEALLEGVNPSQISVSIDSDDDIMLEYSRPKTASEIAKELEAEQERQKRHTESERQRYEELKKRFG